MHPCSIVWNGKHNVSYHLAPACAPTDDRAGGAVTGVGSVLFKFTGESTKVLCWELFYFESTPLSIPSALILPSFFLLWWTTKPVLDSGQASTYPLRPVQARWFRDWVSVAWGPLFWVFLTQMISDWICPQNWCWTTWKMGAGTPKWPKEDLPGLPWRGQGGAVGVGNSSVSPCHLRTFRVGQRKQSQPPGVARIPTTLLCCPALCPHAWGSTALGKDMRKLLLSASFITSENTSFTWSH